MINSHPPAQVIRRLTNISTALLEARGFQELCDVAARSLDDLLTCDKALVAVMRSDGRLLLCSSRSDHITESQQAVDTKGLLNAAMYSPGPLPLTSAELATLPSTPLLAGVQTTLSHPLQFRGKSLGALIVLRNTSHEWTELEECLIAWVAAMVAQPLLHDRRIMEYQELIVRHVQDVERITGYQFKDFSIPTDQAPAYQDADVAQAFPGLTARQREILVRLGESNAQIARELAIEEVSVKGQVTKIHKALGVSTRQEALVVLRQTINQLGG